MSIQVSVIIPTFNDWKGLQLCLNALMSQSFDVQSFEIVVVNNNPSDEFPDNYDVPSNCRIISEEKPGSYAARNKGISVARGKFIAFTDSDCIPDTHWIKNAVDLMKKNTDVTRIGGRIDLLYNNLNKMKAAELYESVYAFRQDLAANVGKSVTANMVVYRDLFNSDTVGLFNENLLSGGDMEWSLRAQQRGYKIAYGDNVIVNHPARDSLKALIIKTRRVAGDIRGKSAKDKIKIVKMLAPPITTIHWSRGRSLDKRIKVFFIKYYLNVLRFTESLKIVVGVKQASRS